MRTEFSLTLVFGIGLLFKFLHWPGAGILLVVSLMTLSMIYFPGGFYFLSDQKTKKGSIAFSIVSGIALSLVPMGVLFKLQYWPGSIAILGLAVVTAPLILLVSIILKNTTDKALQNYYVVMIKRASLLTIISVALYLTPMATLLEIQYWDDPELARIKTNHFSYPENEDFKKQHDDYLRKKDSLLYAE